MAGRATLAKRATQPLPNHEEIFDLLLNARQSDWVELELRDGRRLSGAIIFNDFKGTGRLINIDDEISVDFRATDVINVKY